MRRYDTIADTIQHFGDQNDADGDTIQDVLVHFAQVRLERYVSTRYASGKRTKQYDSRYDSRYDTAFW